MTGTVGPVNAPRKEFPLYGHEGLFPLGCVSFGPGLGCSVELGESGILPADLNESGLLGELKYY